MQKLERYITGKLNYAGEQVQSGFKSFEGELGNFLHYRGRKFMGDVLPKVFPYELIDFPGSNTLGLIEENSRKGRGTIVCVTHFDKAEVPSAIGMFTERFSDQYLASYAEIIIPSAIHQKPFIAILAALGDVRTPFIVNQDTIDRQKKEKEQKWRVVYQYPLEKLRGTVKKAEIGSGMKEFLSQAELIQDGATIYDAIQGGRRQELGEPGIALSMLLRRLERKNITNYDLLNIGSGLEEPVFVPDQNGRQIKTWKPVPSYHDRNGFNPGCRHIFRAGPFISHDDLLRVLGRFNALSDNKVINNLQLLGSADRFAYYIFRKFELSPPEYLKTTSEHEREITLWDQCLADLDIQFNK